MCSVFVGGFCLAILVLFLMDVQVVLCSKVLYQLVGKREGCPQFIFVVRIRTS